MGHEHKSCASADTRGVRGPDGGHHAPSENAGSAPSAAVEPNAGLTADSAFGFELAEHFSGPVAAPQVLAGCERLVPGAARELIACHVRSEAVASDALERTSRAEATAVVVGVVGAQVLTVGALIAGCVLIMNGQGATALLALVPGVLAAAAQLLSATRRRSSGQE